MNITCRVKTELLKNEPIIYLNMYHNEDIVKVSKNGVISHSFVPKRSNNRDIFKCVVKSLMLGVPLRETIVLDIKCKSFVELND